jgi:hypothetical protein
VRTNEEGEEEPGGAEAGRGGRWRGEGKSAGEDVGLQPLGQGLLSRRGLVTRRQMLDALPSVIKEILNIKY